MQWGAARFCKQDEGEIPEEVEAKIFDTLLRIRSQDPAIYQKDVKFFQEEEEGDDAEGGGAAGKSKKAKPIYLKDMIAKQVRGSGLSWPHGTRMPLLLLTTWMVMND